ncbi:MAG: ParB/RepB/Spo0J family partition protein [Bacteroidales bacterium]|nr:ParB/RepB/Spo0J family partition protein [Bacteroidales bacterium]
MGGLFLFSEIYFRKDVVPDMGAKMQEYSSSQEEIVTEGKTNTQVDEIKNLKLNQLINFKDHPFKVETNTELFELMQSIEKDGVLVPLLARPNPNGEGYELISGHRRKAACEWAGVTEVPVIVRDLDNCQAVIAMVDSNLQRENIKPSEKAFAYRMKLEAMKQQGKRNDLTFRQVGEKLANRLDTISNQHDMSLDFKNPTLEKSKIEPFTNENGEWGMQNVIRPERINSNKELAIQLGESQKQVERYIRLTYLIPKILDMVDEGKIAFTIAVELSYLKEEEQYELHAVMDLEQCTPSLSQANRLKRMSQKGELDMDEMYNILGEEKPNQREQIKIQSEKLNKYFPADFTEHQKVELIENLVKDWHAAQSLKKGSR